jgi:hypothetical protein
MAKSILPGLVLASFFSCVNDDSSGGAVKQQDGDIWLSGGLGACAEQIHLANGDTLIVDLEDITSFGTGDRVIVKYKEIGVNKSCAPGIDCEIIEIRKIQ